MQLITVGGRPIPNVLTIIYQKPEEIVAICSHESFVKEWPPLKQDIENLLPSSTFKEINIDGYDLPQIRAACEDVLRDSPSANWLFNVTAATTVMSIGAYEAAKQYAPTISIRCWYLDTAGTRVIPLIGDGEKSEQVFQIEISQYAAACNCRLVSGSLEDKREFSEQSWLPFAQRLGKNPQYTAPLKDFIKSLSSKPRKEEAKVYRKLKLSDAIYEVLVLASEVGLVDDLQREEGFTSLKLSHIQVAFLDGAWLEAYVWDEARKLKIFSDCQWNQKLVDSKKPTDKDPKNELDVSMLYNAQLLVVECKTGDDAFDVQTLYKLDSVANTLGGHFVGRLLVTSLPEPNGKDRNKQRQFEEFKDKADERGITLVTQETLHDISSSLETRAKYPKHQR